MTNEYALDQWIDASNALDDTNERIIELEKKLAIAISMLTLMSETDCLGWEQCAADALNEIERIGK